MYETNFDEIKVRKNTHATKYKESEGILPLCVADMDFMSSPHLVNALCNKFQESVYGYTYISEAFYDSIILWMQTQHNWKIGKEDILYSQSVLASLNSAIRCLTNEDDDILLLSPEYHAFYYLIERNKRNVLEYSMHEKEGVYSIDFKQLKHMLTHKTQALLFSSPHNPIGKVWSYEELKALGEFCYENDLLILCDEIHADIVFKPYKHIPIASISEQIANITITFNSPSKTFNLIGLTLSYIISSNSEFIDKMHKQLTLDFYNKVSIMNDFVLKKAYEEKLWLGQLNEYLYTNIMILKKLLIKYESDITFHVPEATYLVWLDFRQISLNNEEIEKRLVCKARVRLLSGLDFSSTGNGFFRINVALPRKKLIKAFKQIIIEFNKKG
jgi:cystathionine beta-lyase